MISMADIEILVFDFDGVFTDNSVYTDVNGGESVRCSKADSLGLQLLRKAKPDCLIMVCSSEKNPCVRKRCEKLGLPFHIGVEDKAEFLRDWLYSNSLSSDRLCFVGNDLNDIGAMKLAAISACPSDACPSIKEIVDIQLTASGGCGAIRELIEMILSETKIDVSTGLPKIIASPAFPEADDLGERSWGAETLLVYAKNKYTMKRLELKAGGKGGFQYHRFKDEAGILVSGTLMIRWLAPDHTIQTKKIASGSVFRFPCYCVHQEEALEDCVILEVSTPVFNDRVRVEAALALPLDENDGLPTSLISEVIFG